jgi:hypothetical protein
MPSRPTTHFGRPACELFFTIWPVLLGYLQQHVQNSPMSTRKSSHSLSYLSASGCEHPPKEKIVRSCVEFTVILQFLKLGSIFNLKIRKYNRILK